MAFSRREDFPESTLADDEGWSTAGRGRTSRSRGGNQRTTNPSTSIQGGGEQNQQTKTSGDDKPQLRPSWAREPVDIDKSPLISIGRANLKAEADKRWNQMRQDKGGEIGNNRFAKEGAPMRQETPFVQGVQVLEWGQTRREKNTGKGDNANEIVKIDQPYVPSKEPATAHPYQLRPTPTMYAFAQALFKRNVKDWRLNEIITPSSSDGRSILVSAFVDFVSTSLKPDISPGQQWSVAQIAVATAPQYILEYLQDASEARGYLEWVLAFNVKIPPTMETIMCPLDTPNLIEIQRLRSSIRNGDLTVEDQKHVIEVFVKCYYPKAVATVMDAIEPLDQTVLREYIEQPGRLLNEMKSRRKAMPFAPPKWYRLSIHPGTVIPTTPRQQPANEEERKGLQVSLADIELKTKMTSKELAALPLPQMRTAILAAIPLVFEERLTREGCAQAFNFFETASQEQILTFLRIDTEQDDMAQRKEAFLYRHLLRFEHTDKRQRGEWKEPAREILRQWINAIHPVLVANNTSLLLSLQPASRNPLDRLVVTTPYTLEAEEIERHILMKKKTANPNRFEVWIKSSCGNLKELITSSKAGLLIDGYTNMLTKWRVSVEYLCSSIDDHIPIFFLVGSTTTADDALIAEEIIDRLIMADFELDDIPPFHVENSIVGTSTGKIASRTKCVIATKADSKKLQEMISTLHTPASRNRYVVTRDFQFAPIVYPPTDRSDSDLSAAIDRQAEFTSSLVRTTIYGYKGFAPFYDTPAETRDLCTREITSNTSKTVAQLLLTMKMMDENKQVIPTPVIRVSENRWSSKIYLTALKKDAAILIRFTREVINLIDIWYRGHKFQILGDMKDAQKIVDQTKPLTVMQQQALSNVSAVKLGVVSPAQRELDASRTTEALVHTATKGIAKTFAQSTSPFIEETTPPMTGLVQRKAETLESTISRNESDTIRQELVDIKVRQLTQSTQLDEIMNIVRQVLVETEQKTTSKDMMSTITTMLESKSPLSSVTEVATSCRSYFDEQSTKLHTAILENSKEILTAMLNRSTAENSMEVLSNLVQRQEQAAERALAAERAMAERYDSIVKLLEEQKEIIKQWSTQTLSETSVDYGRGDDEIEQESTMEDVTQSTLEKYSTDVRQHARELLALHQTMPYAKVTQISTEAREGTNSPTDQSRESALATKDVCKHCGKKDLMLIYCDTCTDPIDLYHPDCLHHDKDTQTRICQECMSGGTTTDGNLGTPPTIGSELRKTGNSSNAKGHTTEGENIEEVASHHSAQMSISSSSSHSSSSSSIEPYNPTYPNSSTTGTPRTRTLPNLQASNSRNATASDISEISPLQTRGQRAQKAEQKKREDAFDSTDEEEEKDE